MNERERGWMDEPEEKGGKGESEVREIEKKHNTRVIKLKE